MKRKSAADLEVGGRGFAALFGDVELDLLALVEAAKTCALNRADVDEHVLGAVGRLDEAVALLAVEPFNRRATIARPGLKKAGWIV